MVDGKTHEITFSYQALRSNWKALMALAGAVAGLIGSGYTVGRIHQESVSNITLAETKAILGQTQGKLESVQSKIERSAEIIGGLREINSQLAETVRAKNVELNEMRTRVGAADNCHFIREQLKSLQAELREIGSYAIWGQTVESKQRDEARRQSLEQMIARYQDQLGPGACK